MTKQLAPRRTEERDRPSRRGQRHFHQNEPADSHPRHRFQVSGNAVPADIAVLPEPVNPRPRLIGRFAELARQPWLIRRNRTQPRDRYGSGKTRRLNELSSRLDHRPFYFLDQRYRDSAGLAQLQSSFSACAPRRHCRQTQMRVSRSASHRRRSESKSQRSSGSPGRDSRPAHGGTVSRKPIGMPLHRQCRSMASEFDVQERIGPICIAHRE